MFDIERKVFILKKARGNIFKISSTCNNEIVLNCLNKGQIWYEPSLSDIRFREDSWGEAQVVRRDVHPFFSACIDSKDNIHILCQDYSKNIIHVRLKNNQEKLVRVISSESHSNIPNKYPEIFQAGNTIMLCHVAGTLSSCRIFAHRLDMTDNCVQENFLDDIAYSKVPYISIIDRTQNPYLFYKKKTCNIYSLGYKKFLPDTGLWSDFNQVVLCRENSDILSAAINYQDNMYILRQVSRPQGYELICSAKHCNDDKWVDNIISGHVKYPFYNSSITIIENCIIIYWFIENSIFYRLSIDNGHTWERCETFSFNDSSPLCCISYRSNMHGEYANCCINPLPGKITASFRLAFLNELYPRPGNLVTDELRDLICHLLVQNSQSLELLRQSIDDMQKELNTLGTTLNSFERAYANKLEKKNKSVNSTTGKQTNTVSEAGFDPAASLMLGSGFKNVTSDYLKNLRKKE